MNFKKGEIGNSSGKIEINLSFVCPHLCAILLIIKNITMKNSQIKAANCPNCWGHQEYAGASVEPTQIPTFNQEQPNFIRRFVEEHLTAA